jgi:hypothetical protein
MLRKILIHVSVAAIVVAFVGAFVAFQTVGTTTTLVPPAPLTEQAKQCIAFSNAWRTAYNENRIAKLDNTVKGELVMWEGVLASVDPRGDAFDFAPVMNTDPQFKAYVTVRRRFVPKDWKPGIYLRVIGKVRSITALGAVIEGKVIKVVR